MPDAIVVVPLGGGTPDTVRGVQPFRFALWESDRVLSLLDNDESVWRYDVQDHRLTQAATGNTPEAFLAPAFRRELARLDQIIHGRTIVVPFADGYALRALSNAAGLSLSLPDIASLPLAAVSPDGQYLALSGASEQAVFVFSLHDDRAVIRRTIPLVQMVAGESTWVSSMRWSDDSQFLTFSEQHYHPARFYASDAPEKPDPLDWTPLVRMYSVSRDDAAPVLVGADAWVVPKSAAR